MKSTQIPVDNLVSIRKSRNFLLELRTLLSSNKRFQEKGCAEIVCYILFIKHFFPKDFDLLTISSSPLETFYFEDKKTDIRYTLPELLQKYKYTSKGDKERSEALYNLFIIPENGHRLSLLMLLGYRFSFSSAQINQSFSLEQQMEEKNRKIDQLVWNLIGNGSSELTDAENDIDQLEKIVLNEPKVRWAESWEQFLTDRYNENFFKNNRTIAKIGHGPFIDTFRAMEITGSARRIQSRLLPIFFYLYGQKCSIISIELFECLVCCELTQKQDFFKILKFFNSLSVSGSPAGVPVYRNFFSRYMGTICTLGYCERLESWMFELPLPKNCKPFEAVAKDLTESAQEWLTILHKDLLSMKQKKSKPYSLSYVQEEYSVLLAFIQKNQELLGCSKLLPAPGLNISTTFSSRWIHQDEVDRLSNLKESDPDHFSQAVKESYQSGNINLKELNSILTDIPSTDSHHPSNQI